MVELKSGDLCIAGSEQFSDYRDQLVSWTDIANRSRPTVSGSVLPQIPRSLSRNSRHDSRKPFATVDCGVPANTALTIVDGEPSSVAQETNPNRGWAWIDRLLNERMPECNTSMS